MNSGVRQPTLGDDYVVGIFSKVKYENRCDDFTPYYKLKEVQTTSRIDLQSCVSGTATRDQEAQFEWARATGKFTKRQLDEQKALNYFDDNGNYDFSVRYLAKMSGTTSTGNTQNAVAECLRKNGLIGEKDWPFLPNASWNEYYSEIPQALKDKAKKFFNYASIAYEWVVTDNNPSANYKAINQTFAREVKHAPIQITVPICPSYAMRSSGKPIGTCYLLQPQHAVSLIKMTLDGVGAYIRHIWDSYPPFTFKMSNNYPIPYGMKIVMTPVIDTKPYENTISTPTGEIHTIETPDFWARLKSFLTQWGIKFSESVGSIIRGNK